MVLSPDATTAAGAVALAILAGGLVRSRAGPLAVRVLGLVVAATLLVAVAGPSVDVQVMVQPRLRVVADGRVPDDVRTAIVAACADAVDFVEASPDSGELAIALRGPATADPKAAQALLWVQPIRSTNGTTG